MKKVQFFLQIMGVWLVAILAHEAYHATRGTIYEVGIKFSPKALDFFVTGSNPRGEFGAYVTMGIIVILGLGFVLLSNLPREKTSQ